MTTVKKDDLFYVCSLIEFTGRKTKNRRKVIVNALGEQGIAKQLQDAPVKSPVLLLLENYIVI